MKGQIVWRDKPGATPREAIEEAIEEAIREAHHNAMKRTVPAVRICRDSVPYWDEELSALHNERIRAKRYADGPE